MFAWFGVETAAKQRTGRNVSLVGRVRQDGRGAVRLRGAGLGAESRGTHSAVGSACVQDVERCLLVLPETEADLWT